jgi:uncharacterized cupin superfamily protein
MKAVDLKTAPTRQGSGYPPPYDAPCAARTRQRLATALSAFGVNRLTLPPGCWSSQRHWHSHEDEFAFVLEGEVVLITDAGEEVLTAGGCAAFKAGEPDGHHLINRSDRDAVVLEVGADVPDLDRCVYSEADMVIEPGEAIVRHKDGRPYA